LYESFLLALALAVSAVREGAEGVPEVAQKTGLRTAKIKQIAAKLVRGELIYAIDGQEWVIAWPQGIAALHNVPDRVVIEAQKRYDASRNVRRDSAT
jgi:hypothetical protein